MKTVQKVGDRLRSSCKPAPLLLAFVWCAGLAIGFVFSYSLGGSSTDVFRAAAKTPSSLVGSLTAAVLPFLLSFIGVSYCRWFILPISFFKSFSFSFCGYGIGLTFGDASWLVWPLFLFVDAFTIPAVYLYWLKCLGGEVSDLSKLFWLCLFYSSSVAVFDHFVISPFIAELIR